MELREISLEKLDRFAGSQPNSQLLQSASWSKFQKSVGRQTWSLGVFWDDELKATASVFGNRLPLSKSYLYCPRGPVFESKLAAEEKTEALKLILSKARDIAIQTKSSEEIFFRLEPTEKINLPLSQTQGIQPATTLLLSLEPQKEELLSGMHPKTRYNIKLAEKHGITAKQAGADEFGKAWNLFEETARRDKFRLHPKTYYQKMLELPEVELWVALSENGDIISANLVGFYGDIAVYLHGAFDYGNRRLMAPYLLQWSIILEAQKRNFKHYDFHGIAPEGKPDHPWAGVTRYKLGFGGQAKNYPGAFDFIYQPNWYKLYKIFRKLNKLMR